MNGQSGNRHGTADQGSDGGQAARALLGGLIDYAGLFPPKKHAMAAAINEYAAILRSPKSWMLGRFILPVSQLPEFARVASELAIRTMGREGLPTREVDLAKEERGEVADHEYPWLISVIMDGTDIERDIDAVFAFNDRHTEIARKGQPPIAQALVDAVEFKVPMVPNAGKPHLPHGAAFIDHCLESMPEELYPFFEVPLIGATPESSDLRGLIAALAGAGQTGGGGGNGQKGSRNERDGDDEEFDGEGDDFEGGNSGSMGGGALKIRTGGITADAFPAPDQIAAFLVHAAAADVPFKATAGLHHAVRAHYPLTYEPNCSSAVMHGFLNLFLAATLVRTRGLEGPEGIRIATAMLEETDPGAFRFSDSLVTWREYGVTDQDLAEAREQFCLSYGSCAFDEPLTELQRLKIVG